MQNELNSSLSIGPRLFLFGKVYIFLSSGLMVGRYFKVLAVLAGIFLFVKI